MARAKKSVSLTRLAKMQAESHQHANVVVLPDHTDGMMYQRACTNLKTLAGHVDRVSAWFEEPIKLAHAAWKTLTGRRALVLEPLQKAIADQKGEIARYQEMREAEARAHERAQAPAATLDAAMEAGLAAPQTVEKHTGIVAVDVWKWRVVDQARVPEKYKTIDADKINRLVRAMKGETEIPGVEVYQERQIRTLVRS